MPTAAQAVLLRKTAGASRYAYNWAKAEWEKQYEAYKLGEVDEKPTAYSMSRRWTKERPEWSHETARYAQTQAIMAVGKAMINFWNKRAKRPMFKKKSDRAGFQCDNQQSKISGNKIFIMSVGWIRMREALRFSGRIYAVSVSCRAGQWYVSIQVEIPDPPKVANPSKVGVDVGVKALAVASDGTRCENPLRLRRKQKYLRRMQRRLSRQVKGSNRRNRTKLNISRTHLKITNIRQDRIHKFTTALAKNHGTAVLETLDIKGMTEQATPSLRRNLQDTAMREVHRQLEYKMHAVERAPKYFPSSKRCSSCGHVKSEFPCSIRVYKCERCGAVKDRDDNAALNLQEMPWVTGCMRGKGPKGPVHRETVNLGAS
jgi:putative transposase